MMTRIGRRRFPVLLAAIAALLVFIAVDAASSPVQAQTPSADASLSSLSLSDSLGDDIELSATFSAEATSYTASVESTVTSTTVTAETTDDNATAVIMINGVEDADGAVDLVAGYNDITVEVTAEDGTTTRTYTVTVLRAAPEDESTSDDDTITSLLSRLDVVVDTGASNQIAGYIASDSQGSLSPAGFNYPAGFGPWYTAEKLAVTQGNSANSSPTSVVISVRGTVTSVASSGTHRAHVLPSGASITLHLEGENFSKSYSLKNPNERTVTKCSAKDGTERDCRVQEIATEDYKWTTGLPPRFADGDSVLVRLRYSAPRPGTPGRPLVTAPEGKSGALVVKWTAPGTDDPKVRGYEVLVSPAPDGPGVNGAIRVTGGSTTRLPVLLLEPDTAYDVRVRARSGLATGPWSDTVRARTNPLQGTNSVSVELDLDGVTKVKVGDRLYKRLKVTGMNNLHADAFPDRFEGYYQGNFVEFRVLGGIHDSYEYEDLTHGYGEGAFYAGALTIGEDGEVYHNFGYEVIAEGRAEGEKGTGAPEYGPLYLWLERTTGGVQIGSTASSRATALCVEIADDSNTVPSGRECPSPGGSAGHAVQRITARFNDVPQSHDGESEFTFRLAFVKDMGISPTSLREDALAATGGAVTRVQRVDDRSDLFEITAEPDSDEDVTVTLASSGDCGESGAVCTQEEDPRKLYNSPTATVAGPILTASFQGLPSQHDGATAFSFRIAFSDEIATEEEEFRDHSVEVWGGEVTRAEPVGQRLDLWEVEVEPASDDSVMVSLRPTWSCAATGAVCTAGGRLLSVIPATMVPGPATWPVQVTGVAQVGKTLTADSSNLSERYGVQVTSMTYRWLANGARVPGANAQTYRPDDGKQGKKISVMATYTDDRGNEETVTSGPTEPLAARDRIRRATGLPLISGRALVGHTLTADKSLIIDANGLENAVFYYFWEADDESIPGATGTTYTPVEADVGKEITVIVAYVDDSGRGQNMTSPETLPVITEEAAAAVEFRTSIRAAANADGSLTLYWNAPDDDVTSYRILRNRHSLGQHDPLVYVADTGSTATTYTDAGVVAGVPHSYRVQAIRNAALGERTRQIRIFPLRKPTNSPATGAPAISGTAQVGETLTADISGIADEDGLENVTKNYLWAINGSSKIGARYAYQWLVDGADSGSGDHHAGYNNTTYTLAEDDVGKAMSVRVTFVDDAGYQETLTSAATDPVAPAPQPNSPAAGAPAISGTAQVGETLTADTSGITDKDGLDDSTFTHQWVREDSVMVASAARSYTPTDGDRGKAVKVRVSFTDDEGNPETRTSAQTATVEARANSAGICDRTEQVRDAILDQLPNTSDCAAVTDTELSGIIRLALSEKGITTLKSGDFSGLSNLQHLNLADNELSALPDGIFDDLTGLESLYLYSNRLSELPDGIFDDLTGLEDLLFFNNGIRGLPDNIFDNLAGLESLSLGGNEISELPDGVFDNLAGLESLSLVGNWISELPDGVFDNLTGLESLSLGFNDLSELPDGVFDNLTRLYSLGVGNNDLGELPDGIFDNLTGLGALTLTNIDLSELPDGIFDELTRLDTLALSDNELSELPDGIFDQLTRLWSLKLDGNDLSELPDGVFDSLINLRTLSLGDNNLSELPDGIFDSLTKLRTLSLGGNKLSALPEDVFDNLGKLQSLDLNNNELSESSEGVFDGLTELEYLHLNGNELSELSDGIFDGLTELRTVSVDYNELSELPDGVFDNLSELWALSLIGNELSELPDGIFDNLANLKQLYLFSNKLSELPDRIFYGLASMNILYIDENTGSPFTLTAELEQTDENTIALKVAQATPFDMELTLSAEGGSLSSATVFIPAGNVSSEQITVSPDGAEPVTISVVSAAFLLGESQEARGIQTGLGNHLTLGEDSDTNTSSTGAPTIRGTAQVGETLMADTADIADADGLAGATFSYQWLGSRDTEIQGATNATYTLVADDEGKAIKVRVTFTDDAGNEESLTSAATDAVAAAPPPPPDNVSAVTQKSGAVELTWEAPDGATVTGYRIERSRADENRGDQQRSGGRPRDNHTLVEDTGSADTGYTDESAEQGVEYEYRVSARNESGPGRASDWVKAGPDSASNSPATGLPTISGTAQVGETLTANITGIADADGLSGESFTYQWVSSDGTTDTDITDIERATGSTFTLVAVDKGKAIKVRVTFTDDGGNEETLTSAPTGPVFGDGLPGAPRNLAATPGNKEVTLSWDPPADNGNPPVKRYRIEWRIDGKDYDKNHWGTSRSTTYTTNDQANLANGVKYVFRVKAENGSGNSYGPYGPASDEVSATPTSGSAVDLDTPVLSEPEILHHGMVQLDWQDIEDAGWYVVQYYDLEDGEWLDLPAEGVDIAFHGSSAVVSNLHGLSWLRVGAASCDGASEWSQIEELYGTNASDWEGVPVPEVEEGDQTEPCPVVLGTPVLSEPEYLHHGMVQLDWQDIEYVGWYVVQYYHLEGGEWLDLPAEGVDIAFHGSSAVVSNLHGLSWLRVGAASCDGASEWSQIEELYGTKESDWKGVPVPEVAEGDEIEPCSEDADTPENSLATGAPTISGTSQVGETLTANTSGVADADGLSNVQYEYQWLADDSDIAGATGSTYTLVAEDEGKAIKVQVGFTDDAGNEETLTSEATDAVAAATQTNSPATGAPTISGTAQVGETLTANTSGIADADGLSNVQYEYQWLADDADISGATNATYTLIAEDEGKAIKVQVSFTDDESNEESLTSAATDAVAAAPTPNNPATGAPTITGTAQVGETLTANTSGVADGDGLTSVRYEYQWLADDSDISGATNATYTLAAEDEGKAIKVQVSFTDDAGHDETLTSAATDAVVARPNSGLSAPPVVDGPNNVNYVENATSPVARYSTDDPEEDAITWGVSGRDGPAFSIDDGVLKFRTPPNYERPADNDADNEYQVDVVATDSSQAGTTIAVTIKVTDVRDPNIVFIMADDVGYEAFGSYGSTQYRTPRLDELASAGVRFTHTYSKPVCTPSRVALMTGKSNIQNYADFGVLLPGQYTFADLFREAGYTTAIAGKWQLHGGKYSRLTGVEADEAGFDTYCLWNTDKTGENRYWNPSIECDGQVIERGQDAYGPDIFTDFLLEFIESNQDGPFFAYYPMVLPHSPFVPPPDAQCPATDDEQCNFEDMVSRLDHNVGRIHDKLAALELLDNTILVFTSDNGTNRSLVSYLDGVEIHGDKNLPTDGGTRVPLIAVVPGGEGGRVIDDLIDFTDFLPTLADAAALTIPEDVALDGVSFWERLQGKAGHPREWIYTYYFPWPYAYTYNSPAQHPEVAYARDKRYKLYSTGELFDLSEDRHEIHPLPSDHEDSLEARARLQVALYSMPAAGQEIRWSFVNDGATSGKRPLWRPVLKVATVRGNELTLTYAGILRTKVEPPADAFEVQVDGTGRTVSAVSITASVVTLALASPVTVGQTVTVSYTPGTNALQHVNRSSGNTASALANRAVKNETPPNSPATGAPTIDGMAQVGETLTANTSGVADADGLSNVQYEYQWLADDSDISGATNATYTLVAAEDEGKAIKVQVSFTDDADNEETLTSAATDVVAGAQPTEPPAKPRNLSATATHDSVTLTWDDPGDDSITGYVILRRIPGVDPQGHFDELVADTGTAATTYTDNTVAAETRYTYRIKAINGAGTSERSRWVHIDTPAAPVPDKPTGLEATESHGQVVLTWDDPGDDSITGYVILRRVRENNTGGDFSVLVADTGTAATTYTDDTVSASTTYTYRIKAINEHGTSERSRWFHIDIPEAP